MDINRVELKGRVSSDVTTRKTSHGNEWLSFSIVTTEYNEKASIEKDKSTPTWTSIAIFNPNLVKKIKQIGMHQGSRVWLTGKLYVNQVEKYGHIHPYTSVVVNELEVIKTKKSEPVQVPNDTQLNENDIF